VSVSENEGDITDEEVAEVEPTEAPVPNIFDNSEIPEEGNLSCEKATAIQPNLPPTEGTIRSFPLFALEGPCLTGLETIGGWYQVIGNGNVFVLTACTLDISKSVGISVFTGACSGSKCIEHQSRQVAACEIGNGHASSFTTTPGTAYNVLVSGLPVGADLPISVSESSDQRRRLQSDLEADFQLEFTEVETPANSKCGAATPATVETPVEGSTVGLLTTYKTCQDTIKSGAWYTVAGGTPTEMDGVIVHEANTCNSDSNFYNTMSVYRGDSCGTHLCVDVDVLPCPTGWFGQQIYWSTSVKENYQIFVHSSDVVEAAIYSAGSFRMDLASSPRLANDQCLAALDIELNREGSVNGKTSGAKPDMNSIENSSCETGGAGAWYKVTGTGEVFQASTCSEITDHRTGIQVYSGECGSLTCIDSSGGNKALCNDGKASVVNFKTVVDVDYYVLVTGRREGQTGNFGLQIMEIQPPDNNDCSAAVALNPEDLTLSGSTLSATIDFPPGYDCGIPLDGPGVWYEIEGTGRGVEIGTCQDNDFDSAISVFTGSCNNLKCITGASAIDPKCTDGKGVAASFMGALDTKYQVFVHGKSGSSTNMGDFAVSYTEFDVLEVNEFCPSAISVPTDGSRVRGSTEDASHASIPSTSCGVEITNPGLWYTFQGNGQPFEISACSSDEGDFDVSVSVFAGGPVGCQSLTCLTGTTFVENVCSSSKGRRSLQGGSSSAFRFMTENLQDYYIFVHGTEGVGDFDLFVEDENVDGFGTAAPTEAPLKYGKDLFRWIHVNAKAEDIATNYLDLEIINEPIGNATVEGYIITYIPPFNFSGNDMMTVDGCTQEECKRFDVTINVMGDKNELLKAAEDAGSNKLWLLLLLLLLLIPCICLPFYLFYRNKKENEVDDDFYDSNSGSEVEIDVFDDDTLDPDEKGLLPSPRRGGNDSSVEGDDWESSDNEDEGSYDSNSRSSRSYSSGDDSRSEGDESDNFKSGFGNEYGRSNR